VRVENLRETHSHHIHPGGEMMLLNDRQITSLAKDGMIQPFITEKVRKVNDVSVISYGLQSFGYDMRLSNEFAVFQRPLDGEGVVDPKNFNTKLLRQYVGDVCIIPGLILGKSTYARAGIVANFTPAEAGWCGRVTIEISNTSSLPAKVYANEGFAQILFIAGHYPDVSYADNGGGKYQNQDGITLPKV
jgi:dCTP deaminase